MQESFTAAIPEVTEQPFLTYLWSIWKGSMTHPFKFFAALPDTKEMKRPMLYGLLCQSVALLLLWAFKSGMDVASSNDLSNVYFWTTLGFTFLASFIVAPVAATLTLFITSSIYHAMLKLLGGKNSGYNKTFQVICYSSSAQVLALLPVVGTLLAGIYSVFLNIIGIKKAHNTSYVRAAVAIIIPMLLISICTVIFVAWLFGKKI